LNELLQKKPNLTDKASSALGAFYRLDRERDRVGQMASPQHIKQASVRQYIEYNGSHDFEFDLFEKIIFEVDEEFLRMFYEKQNAEARKNG